MLAGVIGWPVEHSRSPAIHLAAAAATGVDLAYTRFAVAPGDGERAAAAMRPLGIRGLSVTMPHKEAVMGACDELTESAKRLGAVNHLTNSDGTIVGNNTDGDGFVLGFEHTTGRSLAGQTVAVFGSGGASRAIIDGCARAGVAKIHVIARSTDRAGIAAAVAPQVAVVSSFEVLAETDVAINATPVGMDQTAGAGKLAFSVETLRDDAAVVDIVYSPLETPLIFAARERKLVAVDGLAMLAGQASAQFATWTGREPPLDVLIRAAHND